MQKVNRITIEFTQSPQGKRCIGMMVGKRTYLLLTVKQGSMAESIRKQLATQFQAESLPGLPLDWRTSLASDELVFLNVPEAIGIYVQDDKFDELVRVLGKL